jgi:hypothetical protein
MTACYLAMAVAGWGLASRYLFRYWIRNDTFITRTAAKCSHGYANLHLGAACHPSGGPAGHGAVASLAVVATLFLPVTLFVILVMHSPPLGNRELAEKTRMLEAEMDRLREQQEDRDRR